MGCCLSRENNKNKIDHSNYMKPPDDVRIDNEALNFVNDSDDEKYLNDNNISKNVCRAGNFKDRSNSNCNENLDNTVVRGDYDKPNLSPISIHDENNYSEKSLKIEKENMIEILLNIKSFDFICNPGNYFNSFYSDFNPELLLTFEEKIENFNHEKNIDVEVDDDYLNRSGQFEQGLIGSSKRKSMNASFSSNNNPKNNRSTSPNDKTISAGDKKVKQFLFENNFFKISDFPLEKIKSFEKVTYINFALFQKNRRDESNSFIIGEGFFPVNFLYASLEKDVIEIPIYNHIEDLFLGNLILKIQTSLIMANNKDLQVKDTFNMNRSVYLNSLNEFLKFQFFNLIYYSKVLKQPFNLDEISKISMIDYNLIKIYIYKKIQKYIKGSSEKDKVLKKLYDFMNDENNISSDNQENIQTTQNSQKGEKLKFKLDFKNLNQIKYFIFLSILNEIMIKCDTEDQNFNLLKTSKFLNEKIIFSPYENFKNDNKNYVLAEMAISLLLNIRKNSSSPLDQRFSIDNLLPYFGNYYKKAATHILSILEKTGLKMSQNYSEENLKCFGPVSNESYLIFRNIIYKFLKLIKLSLEVKNDNLEIALQQKETNNKKNELIDESCKDIESMKRNFAFFFLCTKETLKTKDKRTVEKDLLYVRDINYTVGILNIITSFVKLCKNVAKISRSSPIDIYIEKLLSDNSDFLNFINYTLKIFHKNTKYLNLLLNLLYEIISDAHGIFIFNLFKSVDINLIFNSFNVDARYIDSRKFNTWNSLFIIIHKCCKLMKKSDMEGIDFLNLKWFSIFNQILGLYNILHKNHYFKIADQIDLEFDNKSHLILIKNTKLKFLTNKTSVRVQNKFFEIFYDFTFNETLMQNFIKTKRDIFNSILCRMVYLTLIKADKALGEIFSNSAEHLFKTYLNIMNILKNLKIFINFNPSIEIENIFACIFPNAPSVLEIFKYNKFLDVLFNKIKDLAPGKFDLKEVTKVIDQLKI